MKLSQFEVVNKSGGTLGMQMPDYLTKDNFFLCFTMSDKIVLYSKRKDDDPALLEFTISDQTCHFWESDLVGLSKGYAFGCWPIIQFAAEICKCKSPYLYEELLEFLPFFMDKTDNYAFPVLKFARYAIF